MSHTGAVVIARVVGGAGIGDVQVLFPGCNQGKVGGGRGTGTWNRGGFGWWTGTGGGGTVSKLIWKVMSEAVRRPGSPTCRFQPQRVQVVGDSLLVRAGRSATVPESLEGFGWRTFVVLRLAPCR